MLSGQPSIRGNPGCPSAQMRLWRDHHGTTYQVVFLVLKILLARKSLGMVWMRRGASTSSATAPLAVAEPAEAELVEAEPAEAELVEAMRRIPELLRTNKILGLQHDLFVQRSMPVWIL